MQLQTLHLQAAVAEALVKGLKKSSPRRNLQSWEDGCFLSYPCGIPPGGAVCRFSLWGMSTRADVLAGAKDWGCSPAHEVGLAAVVWSPCL